MKRATLHQLIQDNPLLLPGVVAVLVILMIYAALALADFHSEQEQRWQQQQAHQEALKSLPPLAYWQQQQTRAEQSVKQQTRACDQVASSAQGAAAFRRDIEKITTELAFKRSSVSLSQPQPIAGLEEVMHYRAELSLASSVLANRLDVWQRLSQHLPSISIEELSLSLSERGSIRLLLRSCVALTAEVNQ